jgi:hypothetical protein
MRNLRPAELARGLVLEYRTENPGDISRLGGTSAGTTRWDQDKGEYFNGTDHYVTLKPSEQIFSSGFWSCVIEFTPNFDLDEGVQRSWFMDNSTNVSFVKNSVGSLIFTVNTASVTVTLANYRSYWNSSGRNVIALAYRNNAQTMWLNGVQIGTGAGANASYSLSTSYAVGARTTGTFKFSGYIHSIKFFKHATAGELLTAQEAADFFTRATYRFREHATCILPFSAATHDATNNRTLDVSGKGNHFRFGDGSLVTTFPTKLATRGYSFDAGGSLQRLNDFGINGSDFTVCMLYKKNTDVTAYEWYNRNILGTTGLGQYYAAASYRTLHNNGSASDIISGVSYSSSLRFWTTAYVASTSKADIYLNAKFVEQSPALQVANGYGYGFLLGNSTDHASGLNGSIFYFSLYPFALTPLQIKAEYQYAVSGINKV